MKILKKITSWFQNDLGIEKEKAPHPYDPTDAVTYYDESKISYVSKIQLHRDFYYYQITIDGTLYDSGHSTDIIKVRKSRDKLIAILENNVRMNRRKSFTR